LRDYTRWFPYGHADTMLSGAARVNAQRVSVIRGRDNNSDNCFTCMPGLLLTCHTCILGRSL
jgi:hypothetical protein